MGHRLSAGTLRPFDVAALTRFRVGVLIPVLMCLATALPGTKSLAQRANPSRRTGGTTPGREGSITVRSRAGATVWLDDVRRGVIDATGVLVLAHVTPGRHVLRVRAAGFHEASLSVPAARRGPIEVRLAPTTDESELAFQKAEAARELARDEESRKAAAALYRQALKQRPRFAAAHVGLARVLLDLNDYEAARAEIESAREARPVYPEASAVEGRILREAAFTDEAVAAFRRAIREGHGFQPEAHTGLGRVFEDRGDLEGAASEFRLAIAQLSDTEPVLYQLLGAVYEKQSKYKEAVAAYEKYLQLAPSGSLAEAIRSELDQLRRQAAGETLSP